MDYRHGVLLNADQLDDVENMLDTLQKDVRELQKDLLANGKPQIGVSAETVGISFAIYEMLVGNYPAVRPREESAEPRPSDSPIFADLIEDGCPAAAIDEVVRRFEDNCTIRQAFGNEDRFYREVAELIQIADTNGITPDGVCSIIDEESSEVRYLHNRIRRLLANN